MLKLAWIAFFILCWAGLPSAPFSPDNPQKIATAALEGEPSALVADCVYALSGDYCESAVDLVIPGIEPLIFQRTFTSFWDGGTFLGGWSSNAQCDLGKEGEHYAFTQEHGGKIYFSDATGEVVAECFEAGLTNCAGGQVGAKCDWKNARFTAMKEGGEIITGDNSRYLFNRSDISVHKPNGIVLMCTDPAEKKGKMTVIGVEGEERGSIRWEKKSPMEAIVEGSNGLKVQYHSRHGKNSSDFWIEGKHLPLVRYHRTEVKEGDLAFGRIEKRMPEGRYLWVDHYRKGCYGIGGNKVEIGSTEDFRYGKVASLKEPAGDTSDPVETRRFLYHPDQGMTEVFDAYQRLTRYYEDDCNRLIAIKHYTGRGPYQLYCQEKFYWTGQGRLRCRALLDAEGVPYLCLHYTYDKGGNVATLSRYGPITGKGSAPLKISDQGVASGGECCKTHFTYSTDGFNLKLSEKNRKQNILYKYCPGSDRLTAKLVSDKRKIRIRTFYTYDPQGGVSAEIEDDGSGEDPNDLQDITMRRIIRWKNNINGFPVEKKELFLDLPSKKEILLRSYKYVYDLFGRKVGEELFSDTGESLLKQLWEYDMQGRLCKEVDPLGQVKEYAYDENGNKIEERGPDPELAVRYHYDLSNRLVRTEKCDRDGSVFTSSHSYYYTHQKYTSTDIYGDTTHFRYDDLGRLALVQHPCTDKEGKGRHPKEFFEYNLQGFITQHTNCSGRKTYKEYNIYGKPTRIEYPDGSVEKYLYNSFGDLVQKVGRGGETVAWQYDFLSRPLTEETRDLQGKLVSKREWGYRGIHLIFEKGGDGIETNYVFDPAGRLREKRIGNRKALYFYNSLGQTIKIQDYYGEQASDFIETHHTYDRLGRLIEERRDQSRELYSYDRQGNIATLTTYFGNKPTIKQYRYDILGRMIEERQGDGGKTLFFYDGHQRKVVDPLGNQRVEWYSPQGELLKRELYDPFQKLQLVEEWVLNLEGRKILQTAKGGPSAEERTLAWEYDGMGQPVRKIEAVGTPLQKNHVYNFDLSGRKVKYVKPDGVEIAHFYDAQGNLTELKSSDGAVHYLYSYDRFHRLVKVEDRVQGTQSLSTWDRQGCLSHETLASGSTLSFEHDFHGRTTQVKFSDQSRVAYSFQGTRLKSVTRISPKGETLYQHTYESWNRSGQPLQMQLAGKGGALTYQYNAEGRLTELKGERYCEKGFQYNLKGELLESQVNGIRETYQTNPLAYLTAEGEHRYAYDPYGNRIAANGKRAEVNSLNQVTKADGIEYVYDACGRLICEKNGAQTILYSYDPLDRLIAVEQDGQTTFYTYDYAHRRLTKEVNGVKTFYLYQGQNEIGEQDEKGNWLSLRVLGLGLGGEVGAAVAIELEGVVYVPIHTSRGSVALLLDLEGELYESYHYAAFGETHPSFTKNPWRYCSKRVDPETGFQFFGRRYYVPRLARWLTPDPLEEEGGANLYAFANNNPLLHIDLYGLAPERPSFLERVGKILGSVLKGIGDHLIPIPSIRDAISALGHRLKGGSRINFRELCRNPHSTPGCLQVPRPENESHTYICGLLNKITDCAGTTEDLSKVIGSASFHFCYNSSEGLALDLVECVAQILGIKTRSVEIAAQLLKERVHAVGPQGKVFLHLHSQGGLIGFRAIQKLTPQERKVLHVTTYGSAKILSSPDLGGVTNLISRHDPIPWIADPLGTARAYWTRSDHVKFIPSPRSPFAAHSMRHYISSLASQHARIR